MVTPGNFLKKDKRQKARLRGFEQKKHLTQLFFGDIGLKAVENGRLTVVQLEALRLGLSRYLKKNAAQLWFRQKPLYPITQKPTEIRMGKGKGAFSTYVIRLRAGTVICELGGVETKLAVQLLAVISTKLGVLTKIVLNRRYF